MEPRKPKWSIVFFVLIFIGTGYLIFILLKFFAGFNLVENGNLEEDSGLEFLNLPSGWNVEILASDMDGSRISRPGPNNGARIIEHDEERNVFYVSVPGDGEIVSLFDRSEDWKIDERRILISDLERPHGIALWEDWIYIAEESRVIRVKDSDRDGVSEVDTLEELVKLPQGGHWTRTIKIFNESLFISTGSSCNVCEESDWKRAAVIKCDLNGNNCGIFASGLRNSVDFEFHNGKIWATDNGRDHLGNDLPPDEINLLEEGKDYGWPICYGKQIHDTEFDKKTYVRNPCEDTEPSFIDLQAHSSPLGLDFFEGELYVAYHGSWNRQPPTGYKLVRIDTEKKEVEDFVTGWLDSEGGVHGRPVDVLAVKNSILVTDDVRGVVYRFFK